MDLNTLFSGLDPQLFLNNFWEKAPFLLSTNERDRFESLLTLESLNMILSERHFRTDECKVAADGKILHEAVYRKNSRLKVMEKNVDNLVDNTKLMELFAQGATIVFNQFSRQQQTIQSLKVNIEKQLKATVLTNLFLSPPHSQGFTAHYDSHDVILLQLHGKKHWKVYESPIKLPLKSQAFGKYATPEAIDMGLSINQELMAGELLYIPRGFMHEALTSDETSIHLTLGIHRINKLDFIKDLFDQQALKCPHLRYALPIDFETWPQQEQILAIKDWINNCMESLTLEQLALVLQNEQRCIASESNQNTPNHLLGICQSFDLGDNFILEILNRNELGISENRDFSILFHRNKKIISMPTGAVQGFNFLTLGKIISASQFPKTLTGNEILQLAKTLIAAGVARSIQNSSEAVLAS